MNDETPIEYLWHDFDRDAWLDSEEELLEQFRGAIGTMRAVVVREGAVVMGCGRSYFSEAMLRYRYHRRER